MKKSAVLCGLCLALMAAALASQTAEPRKAGVAETASDGARVCSAKAALASAPETSAVAANAAPDTCKCSCGGENWSPGAIACMSGFKHRCVARGGNGTTNCGWDPVKRGTEQVRCDGGEHCK